eukprot:TRINITY_DN992_c0_g1_i1.p1 TRINITY_DN992_c0_g1~~TRINITY_DN992_c0_g1_i1.p1  ORF type:complete len:176 (+),score=25.97 TRINITY_DN992_c0_g1_i1:53-580(+)
MKAKNILITGPPRVGKTTLIKHQIKTLSNRAGGFYTEEILEKDTKNKRKGFRLKTLQGREGVLAEIDLQSPHKVGRFGVNLKVVEDLAVSAISSSLGSRKEWLVIDEIGAMEEKSAIFKEAIIKALNSPVKVLATIRLKDSAFSKRVKERDDVRVIEMTEDNRDEVYALLSEILK